MKKLATLILLSTLLFTIASCAAKFKPYHAHMADWQGQDEDHVYMIYGPPMRSQELRNGKKLLAYDFQSVGAEQSLYCTVNFEVQDNIVTAAKFDGNYGAVREHVKGPYSRTMFD